MRLARSWELLLLVLMLAASAAAFPPHNPAQQERSTGAAAQTSPTLLQYALPPDKLQKAHALYLTDCTMYFVVTAWSLLVLYGMLRSRFAGGLQRLAQSASRLRIVQAAIVMPLFVLLFELMQLPLDSYHHHLSLQYGLSIQSWGSWFDDWGKGLLLACLFATILGWLLYALLLRSPRRWWFYFWVATIPIVVFVIFVAPIWIEPLFDKFEALSDHHSELVAQIERVVHRAGMDIPPQRMFEMKASEKTTELNAYVTGFGSTKRVVVWDTTMEHMSTGETLFVFGHEMGHYVLGHIPKQTAIILLIMLALFYVGYRLASGLATKFGPSWGISRLSDWASLPLLVLIMFLLVFLATPVVNAVSRHYEHQADQYGLEVIHGLVPDAPRAAAQAFQKLGERSLDYPDVGKLAELWWWTHPTIRDRMIFVQTYDVSHPEFVQSAP